MDPRAPGSQVCGTEHLFSTNRPRVNVADQPSRESRNTKEGFRDPVPEGVEVSPGELTFGQEAMRPARTGTADFSALHGNKRAR